MNKETYYKKELDKLLEIINYNINITKEHYNFDYNEGKLDILEEINMYVLDIINNIPKDSNHEN